MHSPSINPLSGISFPSDWPLCHSWAGLRKSTETALLQNQSICYQKTIWLLTDKNAYGRLKFVSRCCAIKILMADRHMVASTLCTDVAPDLNRMDREQNDNAYLLTYIIIKNIIMI